MSSSKAALMRWIVACAQQAIQQSVDCPPATRRFPAVQRVAIRCAAVGPRRSSSEPGGCACEGAPSWCKLATRSCAKLEHGQPLDSRRVSEGPCPSRDGVAFSWVRLQQLLPSSTFLPTRGRLRAALHSSERRSCCGARNRPKPTAPVFLKARVRHAFRSMRPPQRQAGCNDSVVVLCVA